MGYCTDDSVVRVDFFKPSGKWYTTEAVKWADGCYSGDIYEGFIESLRLHLDGRLEGMLAVCLEPYHAFPYPISTTVVT